MLKLLTRTHQPATALRALGAFGLLSLAGCFLSGCGGSSPAPGTAASSESGTNAETRPAASSPAAITQGADASAPDSAAAGKPAETAGSPSAKEGTAESILAQMIDLRAAELPAAAPDQRSARLRERNEKLVEMAHEVIKKTYKDKSKEDIFNGAVRFLVESQFQLASSGSQEDAKALLDDAKALYERDPASVAAAEAGFNVVRLSHTNALQFGKTQPRFIQEFAVQARLFATRFPTYDSRAVQLLAAAAQTCELNHMDAEAANCYDMLQEKYPKSPQTEQATAVLRRLELKGKRLQLGGETRDGGFVKIEQLRGRPILVVFWSSDSDRFQAMLPQLKNSIQPYKSSGLAVIGVCLDESEKTMDAFTQKNGLDWTEIFYSDPAKRESAHPLVKYYGVHEIPSLWLVDAEGLVVDTRVTPDSLSGQLKYLIALGTNGGTAQ